MRLEVLDLLANGPDILAQALEVLPFLCSARPFAQLAQLTLLVLEHLQGLLLDQGPIRAAVGVAARAQPAAFLGGPIRGLEFGLQLGEFPAQADLLPLLILDGVAEVGALWAVAGLDAETGEVGVAELGFAAGGGIGVGAVDAPALRGLGADVVELVVDLVVLEGGSQGGWHGAGDPVPFVSVVEDVEEGEGGVFVDRGGSGWVDKVPGGADVSVGDVEGVVEVL